MTRVDPGARALQVLIIMETRFDPRARLALGLCVAALSWTCGAPARPAYPAQQASAPGDDAGDPPVVDAIPDAPPSDPTDDPGMAAATPDWDLADFEEEGVPGLRIPIWDPSGRALDAFHAALRRADAGDGKARLAFFGASHVASDWFTGVVRERLQDRFGDGGHGFVLPVKPWRSYRHLGVDIESDWTRWTAKKVHIADVEPDAFGLAGVYVESDHAGGFGAVTRTRGPADRYEVWYLERPGGGSFDVRVGDRRMARVSTEATVPGPGFAEVSGETDQALRVRLRGDGPVRLFGVVVERSAPGVVVDTLGINGARARYQLLWDDTVFRAHLERRAPDLVALAYGTNESGDDQPLAIYERQLREVLARIRDAAPGASCLLLGPSDRPSTDPDTGEPVDRPRTGELVAIQRAVAVQSGCGFFDLVAFSGGPMSMVEWAAMDPPYASEDLVHYTYDGYRRLGDVLTDALLAGYDDGRP